MKKGLLLFLLLLLVSIPNSFSQNYNPYIDPNAYPPTMPIIGVDIQTGYPFFVAKGSGQEFWEDFEQVAQAKGATTQQLFGAFVLYLYHVKGVVFSPQTNQTQIDTTINKIISGYTDSGLGGFLSAQRNNLSLPTETPMDSWLNVTKGFSTLSPDPNQKSVWCYDPRIPPWGVLPCSPNPPICPPEHPCMLGCGGPPTDCYVANVPPAQFPAFLNMSMP